MMPIKEILEMQHLEHRPPVLVIDETTLKCTNDTGPVCGCDEKCDVVKNYSPFIPGAVNPYNRRKIPDNECLEIFWKGIKIGSCGLLFDKPTAVHQNEIPENSTLPKDTNEYEFFLRQPKYTESYLKEKMRECSKREHSDECSCPGK